MILAAMLRTSEDALICDMAETYHVYNWRALPVQTAAVLAVGLRDDSRVKMMMAGSRHTAKELLLAGIADRLSVLIWQNTEDGRKGRNKPQMIVEQMTQCKTESNVVAYNSIEEYEAAREEIRRAINGGH